MHKVKKAKLSAFSALAQTAAAALPSDKLASGAKNYGKAFARAKCTVALKTGKIAFIALGHPVSAAGIEAWSAIKEARNATNSSAPSRFQRAAQWVRAGTLTASSGCLAMIPFHPEAALAAAACAAGASAVTAAAGAHEAFREYSKHRYASARATAASASIRLGAFASLCLAGAAAGSLMLMLPVGCCIVIASETAVSALSRKTQAARRLEKMRKRSFWKAGREAELSGPCDDAYQARPEAFGGKVSYPAARKGLLS